MSDAPALPAAARPYAMPPPVQPVRALPDAVLFLLERLHGYELQKAESWADDINADAGDCDWERRMVASYQHAARMIRHALRDHGHTDLADRLAAEAAGLVAVPDAEPSSEGA